MKNAGRKKGVLKRYFSILTIFLLIISNFNEQIAKAVTVDGNNLITIQVDKSEALPNETVTVSLTTAEQDVEKMEIHYVLPNGNIVEVLASLNNNTGKFEVKIPIGASFVSGLWQTASVELYYKNGSSNMILGSEADLSAGNFKVINENNSATDNTAPTFTSVSVDKKEVAPGDTVKVSVDATDNLSGIALVKLNYSKANGQNIDVFATLVESHHGHIFEANIPIQASEVIGKWILKGVYIKDFSGNYFSKKEDLASGDFSIQNNNIDKVAPVLSEVMVNKQEASSGETITWCLGVTDELSAVASVNVIIKNMDTNETYNKIAVFNESLQKYEATLPIDVNTPLGKWGIYQVESTDKAGNISIFSQANFDFSQVNVNVTNTTGDLNDTIPARINSVSVDKKEAKSGDAVTVAVDATDDKSGVNEVKIKYDTSDGYIEQNAFFNGETNKYESKFTITDTTKPGSWSISTIFVSDKSHNHKVYDGTEVDFSGGTFIVVKDDTDVTPPTIEDISVDKKEAHLGDEVTLSISATDDKSGVDRVYVSVYNSYNEDFKSWATFNESSQKYEVKIPVTDAIKPGNWSISYIEISDKAGNSEYYYGNNFNGANFTVINENADVTPPTVKGISVNKNTAQPGDKVIVSVDATDDKSGIEYVRVRLSDSFLGDMSAEAVYHSETNTYQAEFLINNDTRPGIWKVSYVYVQDNQNNGQYYYANNNSFGNGSFSVINDKVDITPPVVNFISVDKKVARSGDNITLSIGTEDNLSGTNYVLIKYNIGNSYLEQEAIYNVDTKIYEAKFDISNSSYIGTWSIDYIYVEDTQYNGKYLYNGVDQDFKNGAFTVMGKNSDVPSGDGIADVIAPSIPTVNIVSDHSKEITGTTEAGATVTVTVGTKKYTVTADSKGNFKVSIPLLKPGTKLSVTVTDAAGNVSSSNTITVLDKTPPSVPTVSIISDQSKEIIGETEAGASVIVKIGTKKYSAKADSKGNFKVTIPVQKASTKLIVTVTDAAGNVSVIKSIIVIDKTAPSVPKVNTVKSATKEVTGTTEAYATITIKVGKVEIGTAKADKNGKFKVKIKGQKKNTTLIVTATDKAKNASKSATIKVQ